MACPAHTYYPIFEPQKKRFKKELTSQKTDLNAHSSYLYGFNGKEEDNEVKGQGNSYDFGARMYDSRLGRFLSRDPLSSKYPNISVYIYAGNRPVTSIDIGGFEEDPAADNWLGLPPKIGTVRAFRVYASIAISMGLELGLSLAMIEEIQAQASAGGVSGEIGVFLDVYEDGAVDFGLVVTNTDRQYSYSLGVGPVAGGETSSMERTTTISFQQGVAKTAEDQNTKKTGASGGFGASEVNGQLDKMNIFQVGLGVTALLGAHASLGGYAYYAPPLEEEAPATPPPPRTLTQPVDNTRPNQGPTTTNAPAPAAPATPTETSPNNGGQLNSVPLFQIEVQQPDALRTATPSPF
jgi:RHS repeat-associated protein